MPHLLIAGATGSGKSVCITSIAACLAMNNAPEDLRLVMIDSKMVELIRYNGLPHLLGKVETDINRIMGVLRWVVVEMEHRYRLLEGARARDIDVYNRRATSRKENSRALPRIVVLIDELADLMMNAPDQTEHNLVRLAQMARATGIHLVVATQRPSTDVVTGLIKGEFPPGFPSPCLQEWITVYLDRLVRKLSQAGDMLSKIRSCSAAHLRCLLLIGNRAIIAFGEDVRR
jgi:S-DNA-T family DNA segregation ATPase FtsK/SpoIIIE